ncbi:MAG: Crossover junction endodeoxyribonuclease RuvC [Anaerolineae bacterium]|jgi:crossover junction endodeoxyribonuclease RuvC|nr:MAG: Crossover junction endodeoxyribonuclease RuvC [Anaerolineae bacterium]
MIVIGIDPGIAITGYGITCQEDNGNIVVVDYGAIVTSQTDRNDGARLLGIYHRLNEILALHRPQAAAVEKLFFQKNTRTAMAVGQARGVALLALAQNKIQVYEYTPVEIKQALTGYGGADKRQMQEMVKLRLSLSEIPKPDDVADALAIAICHLQSYRLRHHEESG